MTDKNSTVSISYLGIMRMFGIGAFVMGVILIASSKVGEGVTLVAVSLAPFIITTQGD